MYYLYVLKSAKDGSTYIGLCKNLKIRMQQHNSSKTKSVKHRLSMRLIYYEAYQSKTMTLKREVLLKKNSYQKEQLFNRLFK